MDLHFFTNIFFLDIYMLANDNTKYTQNNRIGRAPRFLSLCPVSQLKQHEERVVELLNSGSFALSMALQ